MAKPNNKNRHQRPSYFKENISKFGVNFIERKTPFDLERDSNKIIKDLVYGNVDFETEGAYFYNANLLEACLKKAYENYSTSYYNFMGNQNLIQQGYKDPVLERLLEYNMRRKDAYSLIFNAFQWFKQSGDLNWLLALKGQLVKYRSNI